MKEPKTMGFVIEEIGLVEAQTLVSAGDGKYSDIILMLSAKLPALEAENIGLPIENRKSFAFRLPGEKSLDEKTTRNICKYSNRAMSIQGINWLLRYSSKRFLFVCVPKIVKKIYARDASGSREKNRLKSQSLLAPILELRAKGMKSREIAIQLGIKLGTLYDIVYRYGKLKKSLPVGKSERNKQIQEYKSTHSWIETAEKFGMHRVSIMKIMKKMEAK